MSLVSTVTGCWALLLGIGFMMLGNGLQGTLLGLRATMEGFDPTTTGIVMTGYFVGFVVGSLVVPRMLRGVGHIRVFAALASLASASVLMHLVLLDPWWWMGFRLVTGFCYAGLYVVAESWLNDAATNENRGQLLSVYMVVMLGGVSLGQMLLNLSDPGGFVLFIVISVLVSCSLVPISLSVSPAPHFEAPARVSLTELYRASPLGVTGALFVGVAHASLFGMGAVYATRADFSVGEISLFMALPTIGGIFLQWPIGWLSDVLDRRQVITGVTFVAAASAAVAALTATDARAQLYVAMAVFGGMSLPLYSLCIAHTNDFLDRTQIVAASATLMLVAGIGLSLGPMLVGIAMSLFGQNGFFWCLASAHAAIGVFALYRMTVRDTRPLDEQRHYAPISARSSPVSAVIASQEAVAAEERERAAGRHG